MSKTPTISDRLDRIEKVLTNDIWHELKLHRWLIVATISLSVTAVAGVIAALITTIQLAL